MVPNNTIVTEMNAVGINNAFNLWKQHDVTIKSEISSDTTPATNGDASFKLDDLLKQVEEEAAKLSEAQTLFDGISKSEYIPIDADKAEIDKRSIFVSNVEYSATKEILKQHFLGCGLIERVTIKKDYYTGRPRGCAFMQFANVDSMQNALTMDQTMLLGRQITVTMKRTNTPGISTAGRAPRGRGGRGRGRGISVLGPRSAENGTDSAVRSRGSVPYRGCYRGKRGRRVTAAPY
uniref:RRM domain-containing protein n=1 Tax=Panagrellus redivivus TaxID=6233 RepID=A0A7E4V7A7_PANRE